MEVETLELPEETAEKPTRKARVKQAPATRIGPKHFPRPPRFTCEPDQFFPYWKNLPQECLDRAIVYVYGTWPVLNHMQVLSPEEQEMVKSKKKKLKTNLDKSIQPFESEDWEAEILHRYGSGNYHFKINDVGVRGNPNLQPKQICQCNVTRLQHPDFPPVRDLRLIDLKHPDNQSYIATMRLKGVRFGGEEELAQDREREREDQDMAGIDVLAESNRKLTDTVIEMGRRPTPATQAERPRDPGDLPSHAAERVIDVLAGAAMKAQEIQSAAHDRAAKTQDPGEHFKQIVEAARFLVPTQPQSGGGSDATTMLMMEMLKQGESRRMEESRQMHERHLAEMKSADDRNSRMMELLTKRLDATEQQLRERTAPENKGLLGSLKELVQVKEAMELFNGGGGSDEIMPVWAKLGLKALEVVPAMAANVTYNLAAQKAGARPVPPPEIVAQEIAEGETEDAPNAPLSTEDPEMLSKKEFVKSLHMPLVAALNAGKSGAEFAGAVIVERGQMAYAWIRSQGKDGILQTLQVYPPLWNDLMKIPQRLNTFLDEFLDYEQAMAAAAMIQRRAQQQQQAPPQPADAQQSRPKRGRVVMDPTTGRPIETQPVVDVDPVA